MQIQVCFVEGNTGAWLDYDPSFRLPLTEYPDDVLGVSKLVNIPDGMTGMRILTSNETWTFQIHPTYGLVPRLQRDAGAVCEIWPTNAELGGQWTIQHVLPDGNLLPMVYVEPAPGFLMGDVNDQNRRRVNVPGGFMALTPATIRQWNWYAKATGKTQKPVLSRTIKGDPIDLNDHPVVEVSYWDACAFAQWAGVGIPTEEQWEHAARGNDSRKFPWGNEPPTQELCHSSIQVQQTTTDNVFNRPKGASPYGCLDMSGNVWEWTSTVHK